MIREKLLSGSGFLVAFLFAGACLTPVDIPIDSGSYGNLVVISGQISNLEERSFVEIGIALEGSDVPTPVSQAYVEVTDGESVYSFFEDTFIPGRYVFNGIGALGKNYVLTVSLPDGRVFRSSTETMNPPAAPDQVSHEFSLVDVIDFEGTLATEPRISIYTKPDFTGNNKPLIRWYVEEAYLIIPTNFPDPFGFQPPDCFVVQGADPQRVLLFDGREYGGTFPEPLLLASRKIDQSFHYRHYFSVYQSSLSASSFDYWSKVKTIANQTGSIFDTPPAKITGNISREGKPNEKAFGYFHAVGENLHRFYILKSELPEYAFLPPYCGFEPYRTDYPEECLECLTPGNSTLRRPSWF